LGTEKTKLIEALASLAYSIAKADGNIQFSEKRLFKSIIKKEFKEDAWIAEHRFDILDSAITPTIEEAYKNALDAIRHYQDHFDKEMSRSFLNVVESVADAFEGTEDIETNLLEKMRADFDKLLNKS
jgi:uncharacterized tellurite resistance protein B-like protein